MIDQQTSQNRLQIKKMNNNTEQQLAEMLVKLPQPISQQLLIIDKCLKLSLNSIPSNTYQQIIYSSFKEIVKRSTQPQITHFEFRKGNNQTLYPICGIIAWRTQMNYQITGNNNKSTNDKNNKNNKDKSSKSLNQLQQYNMVNWRLSCWVESGGMRCVPIVQPTHVIQQQQSLIASLKQQVQNIHTLVIPPLPNNYNNDLQHQQKFIQLVLRASLQSQRQLKILSFGSSSVRILNKHYDQLFISNKQNKNQIKNQGLIFSNQKDTLFTTIDPVVQLKSLVKQTQFISPLPSYSIDYSILQQNKQTLHAQSFLLLSNPKKKSQYQILPCFIKHQLGPNVIIYHSLIDVYNCQNMELFGKVIVNFADQVKKNQLKVKNPSKYIGHYPLQYKDSPQKAHYKIALLTK